MDEAQTVAIMTAILYGAEYVARQNAYAHDREGWWEIDIHECASRAAQIMTDVRTATHEAQR